MTKSRKYPNTVNTLHDKKYGVYAGVQWCKSSHFQQHFKHIFKLVFILKYLFHCTTNENMKKVLERHSHLATRERQEHRLWAQTYQAKPWQGFGHIAHIVGIDTRTEGKAFRVCKKRSARQDT